MRRPSSCSDVGGRQAAEAEYFMKSTRETAPILVIARASANRQGTFCRRPRRILARD